MKIRNVPFKRKDGKVFTIDSIERFSNELVESMLKVSSKFSGFVSVITRPNHFHFYNPMLALGYPSNAARR